MAKKAKKAAEPVPGYLYQSPDIPMAAIRRYAPDRREVPAG